MPSDLPSGDVTLLMTDIEASTEKWERYPGAMRHAVVLHDRLLREKIEDREGYIVKALGDSFLAAFADPGSAVAAAVDIQQVVGETDWPCPDPIRVRVGLNTGPLSPEGGDYFGPPVNRLARIVSAGHGGQILVSDLTAAALNDEWSLRDLGRHRLAGISEAQRIFQLNAPGLPERFGPLRTPEVQPNNLPGEVTEFLGREAEIEMLSKLLRKPETALVTLTGPGGVGKSRLAARVAADLMPHFQHGVWWIALSPLPRDAEPELVARRAMDSVRMAKNDGPAEDALVEGLVGHQALLIWDNFEHQMRSAGLVGAMMRHAPTVTHLVTSREILRLSGEYEWVVGELGIGDSVRIFEQAARRTNPTFEMSEANRDLIAQICHRLDCLPLAVELAGSQTRLFTPKQILDRLYDRFALLASSKRDVEKRQQSLEAAIDWSYDSLTESEKNTFLNLCVLSGTFSLSAAQAVCGGYEVLSDVASLREKSLLRTVEIGGEMRFTLLESISQYGLAKLAESGGIEEAKARHVRYFTHLTEEITRGGWGLFPVRSVRRLVRAKEQIRAASQYARELGDPELLGRLIGAALQLPFYLIPFSLSETLRLIEESGDAVQRFCSPLAACRTKFLHGGLRVLAKGEREAATALVTEALEEMRRMDEPRALAALLGVAASFFPPHRAELLAELKTLVHSGDPFAALSSRVYASQALALADRGEEAVAELVAAVDEMSKAGDPQLLFNAKMYLAEIALLKWEPERVKAVLDSAPIGDMDSLDYTTAAMALSAHADVEAALGNYEQAEVWQSRSVAMHEEADDIVLASQANAAAAELALLRGDIESAAEFCRKSFSWLATTEMTYVRLPYLFSSAFLALARGDADGAAALMSQVPRCRDGVFVLGPWPETAAAIVGVAEWMRGNDSSAAGLLSFAYGPTSRLATNRKSLRLLAPHSERARAAIGGDVWASQSKASSGWSIDDGLAIAIEIARDGAAGRPAFDEP